jgi:hypothetical protein
MKLSLIIISGLLILSLLVPCASANTLLFNPSGAHHLSGESQSYSVILDRAPDGLSGYNISVSVERPAVAEIIDITYPSWTSLTVNSSVPSDQVYIKAVDVSGSSGTLNIPLCTITIRSDNPGTTNITIVPVKVEDRIGGKYTPNATPANLTVTMPVVSTHFGANVTSGINPLTVQFTDTSAGSPSSWNWSFGDSTFSEVQNPIHTYTYHGNFTVALNASNLAHSDILTKPSFINVDPVPSTLPIRIIPLGGTVYVGESGLNITQCVVGAHSLAWFQPGLDPSADIPNATVFFTGTDTSFFVSPANFAARQGTWYNWNPGQTLGTSPIALNVTDPGIDITVTDTTTGIDADGRTIPVGDQISFNLTTNMGTLAERGIVGTPVRIVILGPGATSYTTLSNVSGSITPLSFNVPASEYSTGPIWNTANALYPPGKYNITAWYNVNGMAENYPATGKTISVYRTVNTSTSMLRPVHPFPVVKMVTPASANQNSTISFTLTGTDFQPGGTTVEFRNPVTADILTPTLGTVTATRIDGTLQIPDNTTAGTWNIRVKTDGGENTLAGMFTVVRPPRPVITTMTPATGVRTSIVSFTIAGTNFQPGFGNTTVTLFNQSYNSMNNANLTATLTSVTPTAITGTFMVPEDSPFGNAWRVNVTTLSGGRSTSPITFSVQQQLTPTITSITPATGFQNSTVEVTLAGTNFQIGTEGSNVTLYNQTYFGATGENLSVKITSVTPTTIKGQLTIPKAAPEGDRWIVNVTTVDGGSSTSLVRFSVVKPVPTITSMTPISGVRTSVITFTMAGTNFRPGFGNTTVTLFNQTYFTAHSQNLTANLTSVTPTAITGNFTVPEDSPFGNAWVVNVTTADGGMSMSPVTFVVPQQLTPKITAVTPTSGILNSTLDVTVTGTNFQVGNGGSNVTFFNQTYFDATSEYLVLKITSVTPTTIKGKLTIPKTAPVGDGWFVSMTTVDGGNNLVPLRFTVVKPIPTITTMTPTSGVRTSIVTFTLAGTNYQPGIGNTTVTLFNRTYFNAHNHNVTANLTSLTSTAITGNFTVPEDSPFGNAWVVNVTTADGGMSMSPVTFAVPQQLTPKITAVSPTSGILNSTLEVTVTGTNFQVGNGGSNVTFFNQTYFDATSEYLVLKITSVTPTTIKGKLTIPKTAPVGDGWFVNVTTVDGGNNTVPLRFTVVKPVPTITTMTPTSGVRTSIVTFTLAGTNYQPGIGNTTVTLFNRTYFNAHNHNVTANLTSLTPTAITGNFTVPEDSPFGNAWVVNVTTADGGMSMSPIVFAVPKQLTPAITSITPGYGFQNRTVDVSLAGTNFQIGTSGSNVTLYNKTYFDATGENLSVKITSITPTLIKGKITIPKTAPEGDRWVVNVTTVDGGSSISLVRFLVIKPVPTITTMTPTSGMRTGVITFTLAGTNFQTGVGNTTVSLYNKTYFEAHNHNVTANLQSVTPTAITGNFTVPADDPFGMFWAVSVRTADGGTSPSRIIFTEARQTPTITQLSPGIGYPNSTVGFTIRGANYQPGLTTVNLSSTSYGELPATLYSVSPGQIIGAFQLPANAPLGSWKVNVTTADGGRVGSTFTVNKLPVPSITSFNPKYGYGGTTVNFIVTGNYFQPGERTTVVINRPGQPDVKTNLIAVYPNSISGTADLPAGTPPGLWKVNVTTLDGGQSSLANAITII